MILLGGALRKFEHENAAAYRVVGSHQHPNANRVDAGQKEIAASMHNLALVVINGDFGKSSWAGASPISGSDHILHNSDEAECNEHLQV